MQPTVIFEQMRRKGLRRICVISGAEAFRSAAISQWQSDYPGDWLRVTTVLTGHPDEVLAKRARQFLGQERLHALYDASQGINLETLAALAGTLLAGSWLLLLFPEPSLLEGLVDQDSLRWAECEQPISTPVFYRQLWQYLRDDPAHLIWCEGQEKPQVKALAEPEWASAGREQQVAIIEEITGLPSGNIIVTAPRGRGKSALGGMLAAQQAPCLITGPAKISTAVIARFAAEHYYFQSPDTILAQETITGWQWLIIDEAASLPMPQLQALVARFPRCLLLTTTDGYEGTGQGFLLKFKASLPVLRHYQLVDSQRFRASDPLETFMGKLLVQQQVLPPSSKPSSLNLRAYQRQDWQFSPRLAASTFQLLQTAHYRTTPVDLRRMMDAPYSGYWQLIEGDACYGALGWVDEGQQSAELAQAVWRGERRPRGNLVAQSLAAHSRFPQAMVLASRRISRIAVSESLRREGLGRRLVAAVLQTSQDKDFISVSFGFTEALWQFWQQCGFQLVRMGTQREASSGCYAAMALFPLSVAGQQLCQEAQQQLQRDWPILQPRFCPELPLTLVPRGSDTFSAQDYTELLGFAQSHRPLSVSFPALWRAAHSQPTVTLGQCLQHCLRHASLPSGWSHKQWLLQLRRETATLLTLLPEPST